MTDRNELPSSPAGEGLPELPQPIMHVALEDWQDGLRDADITSAKDRGDTTALYSAEQMLSFRADGIRTAIDRARDITKDGGKGGGDV